MSAERIAEQETSNSEWLRRFRALRDEDVAPEERIDRDFLVSVLRGRELVLFGRYTTLIARHCFDAATAEVRTAPK